MNRLVLEKILSARFWISLMFSITMCYLTAIKVLPAEAFIAIAGIVIKSYFERHDRNDKPGGQNGNQGTTEKQNS